MSCWPLLKGTLLPLRTPPGWPFFACSCCVHFLMGRWGGGPSKVHPELPKAMSAFWHCHAAALGGRHQDRAQNILISFKWTFLSHSVLSFCSFLPWKCATPRGCLGLLLLTLKLSVSSLTYLGKAKASRDLERGHITSTGKFLANL